MGLFQHTTKKPATKQVEKSVLPWKVRIIAKLIERNPTMKSFIANWQTSIGGLAGLLSVAAVLVHTLADGFQVADIDVWVKQAPALLMAWGVMVARQQNVTSEQSGAK